MKPHEFLESLTPSTMKFGLERMRACDASLGEPWRAYRSLHVAGTNGKGSTCAFAEAILREAGLLVGLYTSPHLESVNERIRIDGRNVANSELARGIESLCAAYPPAADPTHPDTLTYFEFLTALALWLFREAEVDVAIVEVGLGGRLDATNVITPAVCAIATIGLDHTEYLGDSLAKIAAEKAGILKPGVPAAVLTREPGALGEIQRVATQVGAPLYTDFSLEKGTLHLGTRRIRDIQLALAGAHQQGNAALAAQAAVLLQPMHDDAIRSGLATASWPGRLETVNGVLIDGAHNPEGARALAIYLESLKKPVHLVFGALGDKDVEAMVAQLAPQAARAYLVKPQSPRALEPERYLARVREFCPAEAHSNLADALAAARQGAGEQGLAVVAGSLYLVGPARRILSNALGAAHQPS